MFLLDRLGLGFLFALFTPVVVSVATRQISGYSKWNLTMAFLAGILYSYSGEFNPSGEMETLRTENPKSSFEQTQREKLYRDFYYKWVNLYRYYHLQK